MSREPPSCVGTAQVIEGWRLRSTSSMLAMSRYASLAQLAEHALRKRMVMGSIPIGGSRAAFPSCVTGQFTQAPLLGLSTR